MEKYTLTKTLGVIVGTLTIFTALGFIFLSLIGVGLSKAFNTGNDDATLPLLIFIFLLLFGLITGVGSFKLKSKISRYLYIGFSFILGIGFVLTFFISLGALGFKNEIFILFIGLIYLLLCYLAVMKK